MKIKIDNMKAIPETMQIDKYYVYIPELKMSYQQVVERQEILIYPNYWV